MDPTRSSSHIHPIQPPRSGRGIQEAQVWEAADMLLQEGLRPTIERVRQKIGSGSPNTVSPILERWFATLGKRLQGRGGELAHGVADSVADTLANHEAQQLPLAIVQAAQQFWDVARREADQAQRQKTEATWHELDLEREVLAQKASELSQCESSFEQARAALEEALASSRQAVAAMESQMHTQQQESARLLSDSETDVRRLRKALDEAVAGKEALREKSAMELSARQRAADEAEERHVAQERRFLAEIDRERMATRQAHADLARSRKRALQMRRTLAIHWAQPSKRCRRTRRRIAMQQPPGHAINMRLKWNSPRCENAPPVPSSGPPISLRSCNGNRNSRGEKSPSFARARPQPRPHCVSSKP